MTRDANRAAAAAAADTRRCCCSCCWSPCSRSLSDRFLTPTNFINIVTQAAHIAIIAIGMTFVLLVAGIDLSVGANMYASCIVVALYMKGWHPVFGFVVAGSLGLAVRRLQRLHHHPAARAGVHRHAGDPVHRPRRGALPVGREDDRRSARRSCASAAPTCLGIPVGDLDLPRSCSCWPGSTLRLTTFGRQVYAVGADPEAAAKAGIDVPNILFAVYCICGVLRRHRRAGLGEPGGGRLLDLRLPEGVPGDRRRGAGRHLPVRRPRRGASAPCSAPC